MVLRAVAARGTTAGTRREIAGLVASAAGERKEAQPEHARFHRRRRKRADHASNPPHALRTAHPAPIERARFTSSCRDFWSVGTFSLTRREKGPSFFDQSAWATVRASPKTERLGSVWAAILQQVSLYAFPPESGGFVPETPITLRVPARCGECGARGTVRLQQTLKGANVTLPWYCTACHAEWPVRREDTPEPT